MTVPEIQWLFSSNDRRRLKRHPAFGLVAEIVVDDPKCSLLHARALDFSRYGIGFALTGDRFSEGDWFSLTVRLFNDHGELEAEAPNLRAQVRSRFQSSPTHFRYGAVFGGVEQQELDQSKQLALAIVESKLLERVAHETGHLREGIGISEAP